MLHLPVAGVTSLPALIICVGLGVGALGGFFGAGRLHPHPGPQRSFGIPYAGPWVWLSQMAGLSLRRRATRIPGWHYRLGLLSLVGSTMGVEIGARALVALGHLGDVRIGSSTIGVQVLSMKVFMPLPWSG